MSHCQTATLDDRAVIRIAGTDAQKFLQGLITNDMARAGNGLYAALLTPQGKILFDFFIVADGDGAYLLDCRADQADGLIQRLSMYRLRAAVEIARVPDLAVAAIIGEAPSLPEGATAFPDPRLAALGLRAILPAGALAGGLGCTALPRADYDALRILNGIPEGAADFTYGDCFPHEALLDQLNGVDFAKGCFVGQEVVSRMEHRGTARKRIVPVIADQSLPASGSAITAGDIMLGTLGSISGKRGLALLRLDRAAEAIADGAALLAGDVPIRLERPGWAHFDAPEAAFSA